MLERTDAITNEVLEPITFVLAYPIVLPCSLVQSYSHFADMDFGSDYLPWKMYFGLVDLRRWMTKGNATVWRVEENRQSSFIPPIALLSVAPVSLPRTYT